MAEMSIHNKAAVLTFAALVLLTVSTSVLAGFEIRRAPSAPAVPDVPVQNAPAVNAAPLSLAPPPLPLSPPSSVPVSSSPVPADAAVVTGFGAHLPLAIALQQIAPPGYQFSFARGVNAGTPVSWEGGKPWQQVLKDTLAPVRMEFSVKGNTVQIRPAPPSAAAPAALPSRPPAPPTAAPMATPGTVRPMDLLAKPSVGVFASAKAEDAAKKPSSPAVTVDLEPLPEKDIAAPAAVPPKPVTEAPPSPKKVSQPAAGASAVTWLAPKDKTLRQVLTEWSSKAGAELYWSVDYDYLLNDNAGYGGSFEEAVAQLLGRFGRIIPQPYGRMHQTAEGKKVLVINTYETIR